jgi:hypothetical protein
MSWEEIRGQAFGCNCNCSSAQYLAQIKVSVCDCPLDCTEERILPNKPRVVLDGFDLGVFLNYFVELQKPIGGF